MRVLAGGQHAAHAGKRSQQTFAPTPPLPGIRHAGGVLQRSLHGHRATAEQTVTAGAPRRAADGCKQATCPPVVQAKGAPLPSPSFGGFVVRSSLLTGLLLLIIILLLRPLLPFLTALLPSRGIVVWYRQGGGEASIRVGGLQARLLAWRRAREPQPAVACGPGDAPWLPAWLQQEAQTPSSHPGGGSMCWRCVSSLHTAHLMPGQPPLLHPPPPPHRLLLCAASWQPPRPPCAGCAAARSAGQAGSTAGRVGGKGRLTAARMCFGSHPPLVQATQMRAQHVGNADARTVPALSPLLPSPAAALHAALAGTRRILRAPCSPVRSTRPASAAGPLTDGGASSSAAPPSSLLSSMRSIMSSSSAEGRGWLEVR